MNVYTILNTFPFTLVDYCFRRSTNGTGEPPVIAGPSSESPTGGDSAETQSSQAVFFILGVLGEGNLFELTNSDHCL